MNIVNDTAKSLTLLYREFLEYFVWSTMDKIWTIHMCEYVIGRAVTCHLTEGERYLPFILLLMNIKGPKSFQDLLTINDKPCTTFRDAAEKRGLVLSNNNLIECMSEAVNYQMSACLRHLFAMLLDLL